MIDIHAHFLPPITREQAIAFEPQRAPWLEIANDGLTGMIVLNDRPFRPVYRALWDADARIAELDSQGVELQIVCATPVMFGYDWPAKKAAHWAALMNEQALQFCSKHPTRLKALAQVPLQDLDLACAETVRAMESGCVGVQIGNHLGNRNLDDPNLVEYLIFCARSNTPVLVHPWDMMGSERMKKWMLPWLVSMPAETQLGMLSLILSGALQTIPKELKICFAHGGGSFAYLLGRVDNAWRQRDIVSEDCPNLPSSYAHRFHVDTAIFDPQALKLLTAVMGKERLMLGSDYPFPLGERPIGALIGAVDFLNADDKTLICKANAREFFFSGPTS